MGMISCGIHKHKCKLSTQSFVTEAVIPSLVQVAGQWGNGLATRDQVDQWDAGAQIWGECVGAPTFLT